MRGGARRRGSGSGRVIPDRRGGPRQIRGHSRTTTPKTAPPHSPKPRRPASYHQGTRDRRPHWWHPTGGAKSSPAGTIIVMCLENAPGTPRTPITAAQASPAPPPPPLSLSLCFSHSPTYPFPHTPPHQRRRRYQVKIESGSWSFLLRASPVQRWFLLPSKIWSATCIWRPSPPNAKLLCSNGFRQGEECRW